MVLGAESAFGPALCGLGLVALAAGGWFYGVRGRPTLLPRDGSGDRLPDFWEKMSVHLLFYAVWGIGFGAIIWRGLPAGMIDVRFAFERNWPVIQATEWIYLSVYLVPLLLPWWRFSRAELRRYALDLWWLLLVSMVLFLVLPFGSPPRPFQPNSWAGILLQAETGRPDFAAASWPSFHLLWALLCADLASRRGPRWALFGWSWAAAVAVACMVNGAHAMADIVASAVIYPLVMTSKSPLRRGIATVEAGVFGTS